MNIKYSGIYHEQITIISPDESITVWIDKLGYPEELDELYNTENYLLKIYFDDINDDDGLMIMLMSEFHLQDFVTKLAYLISGDLFLKEIFPIIISYTNDNKIRILDIKRGF
ncbi:MAG: hypothetical protein JRE40_00255 [Deltaproteobacteria bacterium]|nr:hypothetical protein [Deltaproteobacteria bacterium]